MTFLKQNWFKIIIITLLILAAYGTYFYWQTQKHGDSNISDRCVYYVKYDPHAKAWYWQVPVEDGYFPTKEEAVENCKLNLK